jgi:pilus assembly protein FimV
MAFGFGFNKQKLLSAAEKFVQQGKLQNAIAEYEKIRKHDDKDLTVTNTIGDLYARLGDSAKAIECFKAVGDAYAAQGFTVKGIAMYKKITKLQPSVDGSLKLAELYTQQGLFNDARAQYLQVAEDFMKSGDLEQAVRLFQKVLEMDPENVPMRVKLAEVYIKLGKKKEAWEIFSAAAESLRARGSLAAAEDILQRMLSLDPGNSYVLLMRGRAALESDDPKNAIQYLEKAADIDTHPEGLRDLLKAYLESGDLAKGAPLAEKLLTVHNDPEGLFLLAEGAARLGHYEQALEIYTKHAERLLSTDSTKLLANLHSIIAHVQGDPGALEQLMDLLKKAGESTHVNEVAELLAHASVKSGNLERARDLYQMLATSEPQNAIHTQNYQQVIERMEGPAALAVSGITAEEGALIVEELEATAPVVDQTYPDHIAVAVRSAVTDADLFLSYNLPDKAVVPLLGALPQAPRDVRLNQRLAALHTRFRRFTEAAVCCRTLEGAYHDAGYPDEAMRYGELAARYEQSAGTGSAEVNVPLETETAPELHMAETEVHAHPEFSVHEIPAAAPSETHDVSSEWEHSLSVEDGATVEEAAVGPADAESNPEIAETAEEIRFYLEHFMTDQARAALEKLETLTQDASILGPLRTALESGATPAEEAEPEIAEINADDPATFELDVEAPAAEQIATSPELMGFDHGHDEVVSAQVELEELEPAHEQVTHFGLKQPEPTVAGPARLEAAHAEASELTSLVADLEASLGDSFPTAPVIEDQPAATEFTTSESIPAHAASGSNQALPSWPLASPASQIPATPQPERVAHAGAIQAKAEPAPVILAGTGAAAAAAPAMSYSPTPVRPLGAGAQAMHPSDSVDLSEMFGELKHELEEDVATADADPETHYNLGVAFREMGLLDEAIAELQKVCTAIERGHPFAQTVQTYTWLAQCFLDKGVPQAAIRWYEKALNIPGLDGEARVAINYELGSACETAQDRPAALRHFTYVYGANIDYRDVAERIQALKS